MKRNEESEGDCMIHSRSCKSEIETAPKLPIVPSKALITSPPKLAHQTLLHLTSSQYSWHWALGASLGCSCMAADSTDFRGKDFQFLILSSSPASLCKTELQARGRWLCLYHSQRSQPLRMSEQEPDGKHPSWNSPSQQQSSTLWLDVTFDMLSTKGTKGQ